MNKHNFLQLSPDRLPLVLTIADFKEVKHPVFGKNRSEKRIALLFEEPNVCPFVLTNERCGLLSRLTGTQDPKGWVGATIGLVLKEKVDKQTGEVKEFPEMDHKRYSPKRLQLGVNNAKTALEQYKKTGNHYWLMRHYRVNSKMLKRIEEKANEIAQAYINKEFGIEEELPPKKTSAPKAPSTKKLLSKDNERHMAVIDAKFQQLGKEERYTYDDLIGPMEDCYEMDDATRIEVQELAAKWGYPSNLVRK
ncbi:MAG: hypothetical protein ACRBFS_10490 [Aureispira sp.]